MDNNQNNQWNNDYNNMWGQEQKIKNQNNFFKGLAVGITVTIVFLVIILVANKLISKDYIETDDTDKMLENSGLYDDENETNDSNDSDDSDDSDNSDDNNDSDDASNSLNSLEELLEAFEKAQMIQELIEEYFYYEDNMDNIAEGIYAGMLESLNDPYSVYYDKESFEALMESTSGTYYGIGVAVVQDPETMIITVVTPYENCPGYDAGIRPGDIFMGADDVDFTGMDVSEAVSYIKGEEGTTVDVHILRNGEKLTFTVERKMIDLPTVEYEVVDGNIAHIYISSFDDKTYKQFKEAMEKAENDGVVGYIFDVRDNGGGLYDRVVEMLDYILPEGKIVYTEDKYGNRETEYSDAKCLDAPMAVLINGNSASASEIFAGAIQDYGVGKLFGTTTFGKGIVQSIIPLSDGTAVKLTISSYFTPNGRNIHGEGITPDVEVKLPQVEDAYDETGYLKDEYDTQLQEAIKYIQSQVK